jgi:hypothetical protein
VLENYKGPERRKRQHAQDITKDVLGIKREEAPV